LETQPHDHKNRWPGRPWLTSTTPPAMVRGCRRWKFSQSIRVWT